MKIKNIIFDLDGTLADTLPGIEYSCNRAISAVLPGRVITDMRLRVGPPIRDIFRQAFYELGGERIDELEYHFRLSYDSEGWSRTIAFPSVIDTVAYLSRNGIRCSVVTNKPNRPALKILNLIGIMEYFDYIISPDSKQPPFDSKESELKYLMMRAGFAPDQSLLVGDSYEDYVAAKRVKIMFAAAAYGYGYPRLRGETLIKMRLEKMSDLIGFLSFKGTIPTCGG